MDTIPRKSVEMYSKLIGKLPLSQAKTVILRVLAALAGAVFAQMYMKPKPTALTLEQRKDNLKKMISDQRTKIISQAQKMKASNPQQVASAHAALSDLTLELNRAENREGLEDQKINKLEGRIQKDNDAHIAECKQVKGRIAELRAASDARKKSSNEEINSLEKEIANLKGR